MPDGGKDAAVEEGPLNSRVDEAFRLDNAAKLSVRGFGRSRLAVTELRYDLSGYGATEPIRKEDAFLIGLQLRALPVHVLWFEGREIPVRNCEAGDTLFYDLKTTEMANVETPFHSLQFYLSRPMLRELADDLEARPVEEFRPRPGQLVKDRTILRLGRSLRPALAAPHEANELFASHLMLTFGLYVTATYAGLSAPRPRQGGLNAWQERVARELIDAHIDGSLALQTVAEACGLSTSHFAHAFKASIGMAPHRWLLLRRVARARDLLRRTRDSLTDVALACGFADQSHFTRVFRRATGHTPRAWKQMVQ
jgi:AraC-like DNA-binding protein